MTEKQRRCSSKPIVVSGRDATAQLACVERALQGPAPASRSPAGFEPRRADRENLVGVSTDRYEAGVLQAPFALAVARVPAIAVRPRALVVDDDAEVRRALARLLRPELDVRSAGSVAQAEQALATLDRIDVAFVDWELPDGTGEQILERLARWPDAIRVLISARVVSGESPLENRALANLVLGKPVAGSVIEALKRAALVSAQG